MFTFPASTF